MKNCKVELTAEEKNSAGVKIQRCIIQGDVLLSLLFLSNEVIHSAVLEVHKGLQIYIITRKDLSHYIHRRH